MTDWESNEEIKIFREYLRIPSVHPDVDYDECIEFLKRQAISLTLPIEIYYPAHQRKPVAVITWIGNKPDLPSIVLNSHMDVVPVFADQWSHPPFAAEIDKDGKIFARGTQDMKSVGMQYLAAIRELQRNNVQLKRTIHVTFVPDEEIGGENGMKKFVETNAFRALNVGFSLDEGVASPNESFTVFYAERCGWRIHFKCKGLTGHGSQLFRNTAGEKFRYIIDRLMDLRDEELQKLENNPMLGQGDVTAINLTILNGGVQNNVLPAVLSAVFDVRLALDIDHVEFKRKINRWCDEAGGNIEVLYELEDPKMPATAIDDSNPFWKAFKETMIDHLQLKLDPMICPGGTDSRYLRAKGVQAIGISPINNTPILLHNHDEYITAQTYLNGVKIYAEILLRIANV